MGAGRGDDPSAFARSGSSPERGGGPLGEVRWWRGRGAGVEPPSTAFGGSPPRPGEDCWRRRHPRFKLGSPPSVRLGLARPGDRPPRTEPRSRLDRDRPRPRSGDRRRRPCRPSDHRPFEGRRAPGPARQDPRRGSRLAGRLAPLPVHRRRQGRAPAPRRRREPLYYFAAKRAEFHAFLTLAT